MSSAPGSPEAFETLRHLQIEATQQLLGDTIDLSEEDWTRPTPLPGWTRAHVASHLARHAEASAALVRNVLAGTPAPLYPDRETRNDAIEAGARRRGLELQTDLDRTAGELEEVLESLTPEQLGQQATLREGMAVPLGAVPLVRLSEVALHHVDLGVGLHCEDIPTASAMAVLDYYHGLRLAGRGDYPPMTLVPEDVPDRELVFGPGGPDVDGPRVRASAAVLLGLLTRRIDPTEVPGAERLRLPDLG